jgi:hypothetical protein
MYVSPLYFWNAEKQIGVVILAMTDLTCAGNMDWTCDPDLVAGPDTDKFDGEVINDTSTYVLGLDIMIQKFKFHGQDAPYQAQRLIQKYYREVDLSLTYAEQIDFARAFTA